MNRSRRPLRPEDVSAWAAMAAEAERVDQTGENYDAEDFAEELADPLLNVEAGTRAIWEGGELIAVGLLNGGSTADPWRDAGSSAWSVTWPRPSRRS